MLAARARAHRPVLAVTYATWNPSDKSAGVSLTNGNLTASVSTSGSDGGSVRATIGKSSGKWYFEFTAGSAFYALIGLMTPSAYVGPSSYPGADTGGYNYYAQGVKFNGGSQGAYGGTYTAGDIIGVAVDFDARTITFYKNGTNLGAAFTFSAGLTLFPATGNYTINAVLGTANFGATAFAYPVPAGHNAGWYV